MSRRYGLSDEQWAKIEPLIPKGTGRPRKNNRLFIEAILYRYRSGIPWRDLPERFGDFRVVHTRFTRWAKRGIWEKIFHELGSDSDNEYAMLDSTIVRAHQHSAGTGEDIGRSSGGLSTKIHTVVDALGNPLIFFDSGSEK